MHAPLLRVTRKLWSLVKNLQSAHQSRRSTIPGLLKYGLELCLQVYALLSVMTIYIIFSSKTHDHGDHQDMEQPMVGWGCTLCLCNHWSCIHRLSLHEVKSQSQEAFLLMG